MLGSAGRSAFWSAGGIALAAQAPPRGAGRPTVNVEADPIRCWWRTSASAVRVGEPFSLVLTCAIVENETTTVVPDQSRLEPAAMQLPPFEVIGGQRGPDLRSDSRRFFQYQYSLRLINEEMFGKDAHIPSVQISYHLEPKVGARRGGSRPRSQLHPAVGIGPRAVARAGGRDRHPRRAVLDLRRHRSAAVPRARVYRWSPACCSPPPALVIVIALVRLLRRYRQRGLVGRRLHLRPRGPARRRPRARRRSGAPAQREGWTRELAGRALAALRIAGSVALGRAGQPGAGARRRQRVTTGSWHARRVPARARRRWCRDRRRPKRSPSDSPPRAGCSGHRAGARSSCRPALARFTTALFGREQKLDDTALGESLSDSFRRRAASEARKPLAREEVQGRDAVRPANWEIGRGLAKPSISRSSCATTSPSGGTSAWRSCCSRHRNAARFARGAADRRVGRRADPARSSFARRGRDPPRRDAGDSADVPPFAVLVRPARPLLLFLCGLPFFLLALADPFTSLTQQEVSFPGRRIGLLIDASSSMMEPFKAAELGKKAPSDARFFTAVAAAQMFVKQRMKSKFRDLIALIEFGDESYVITPFTNDYDNILLSISLIDDLTEFNKFPDQGTTIGMAISQAVKLFTAFDFLNASGNLMVIFSDGEDTKVSGPRLGGMNVEEILSSATQAKIPVYFIRVSFNKAIGRAFTDPIWKPVVEKTGGKFYAASDEATILSAIRRSTRWRSARLPSSSTAPSGRGSRSSASWRSASGRWRWRCS